jgi:hypothetical protein
MTTIFIRRPPSLRQPASQLFITEILSRWINARSSLCSRSPRNTISTGVNIHPTNVQHPENSALRASFKLVLFNHAVNGQDYIALVTYKWTWRFHGMTVAAETKLPGERHASMPVSTINTTWSGLRSKPGLGGERQATNSWTMPRSPVFQHKFPCAVVHFHVTTALTFRSINGCTCLHENVTDKDTLMRTAQCGRK